MAAGLGVLAATIGLTTRVARAQSQSPPSVPARAADMQHHFSQLTRIHEALIRGDLKAVLAPAAELATTRTPEGFPASAETFVDAIRRSARRAGTAPNLRTAAAETVALAGQCAACHQAVGMYPSPASPRRPDLPSIVGHMIEHQRAADDMLQGLVMPSASRWTEAARRLDTATLDADAWPRDAKLRAQARQADADIHALAERAYEATTPRVRANLYVDLVMTCAGCHSLHRGVWGPRSGR